MRQNETFCITQKSVGTLIRAKQHEAERVM